MNGSCGKLFTAARRTHDEDPTVGRRDFLDRLAQLVDRRGMPDQRRGERSELLELPHLAFKPRILKGAVSDQQQSIGLERLLDEVVSAALDRGDRGLDVTMTRDHDDRQFWVLLLETIEQLQTIEAAALQPDVEKDEIGPPSDHGGERVVAVTCRACAVAFILKNARDELADVGFVVNDQDIGCYVCRLILKKLIRPLHAIR